MSKDLVETWNIDVKDDYGNQDAMTVSNEHKEIIIHTRSNGFLKLNKEISSFERFCIDNNQHFQVGLTPGDVM